MIAMLMECKGELIRGTRGSRVLLDESADIELIVRKHLPPRLALVLPLAEAVALRLQFEDLLHAVA
eukprot:gene14419-17515_t